MPRNAKFARGDHRDSMQVVRRGRGGKRTRRHLRGWTGAAINPSARSASASGLLVAEPLQTALRCAEETTVRFGKKGWLRRCAATRRWR
ncbi:MAG: hypothetical protein ACLUI3_15740 [Christensenellales bacterium]